MDNFTVRNKVSTKLYFGATSTSTNNILNPVESTQYTHNLVISACYITTSLSPGKI